MKNQNSSINVDIIIFGGGIAGLWLLNRLNNLGYSTILLESNKIGNGQTISSQGIIHGGTKYALKGKINQALTSISNMPAIWRDCINNQGELNLQSTKILSQYQYLWPASSTLAAFTTFLASKVMVNKVDVVPNNKLPDALKHKSFNAKVYRLNEIVLDIPTLLHSLAHPLINQIIKIDFPQNLKINTDKKNNIQALQINDPQSSNNYTLQADLYVFTAGQFNQNLGQHANITTPPMQTRPLHMVMLRSNQLKTLYAHCIDKSSTPRLTITTHKDNNDNVIWYIGGAPAESGTQKDNIQQFQFIKNEINTLLPWIKTSACQWASFIINRAEPQQPKNNRPNTPFAQLNANVITAWPTKLAFAPQLASQIIQIIKNTGCNPSQNQKNNYNFQSITANMTKPEIAPTPWEDPHTKWYEIN